MLRTDSQCAASVSPKRSGSSFLMRRKADKALASFSAALAATASRFARRLASFELCHSIASCHVSWSQNSRSGQMFTKWMSFSRSGT
eukprot:519750-Pleurochrysis_carterae.AAC.2